MWPNTILLSDLATHLNYDTSSITRIFVIYIRGPAKKLHFGIGTLITLKVGYLRFHKLRYPFLAEIDSESFHLECFWLRCRVLNISSLLSKRYLFDCSFNFENNQSQWVMSGKEGDWRTTAIHEEIMNRRDEWSGELMNISTPDKSYECFCFENH